MRVADRASAFSSFIFAHVSSCVIPSFLVTGDVLAMIDLGTCDCVKKYVNIPSEKYIYICT